jgi:hypothetical protein
MAISNVSSGLRPGVCTSTTRPQAPFEGQMIYETDTNRVLVWDNAAWVMIADTDQPPGLQLIKTQTVGSGVSSVEVTGAFSSEFDNYLITASGGTPSTASILRIQLGSTTSGYYYNLVFSTWSTSVLAEGNTTSANVPGVGHSLASGMQMFCQVFEPNRPTFTRVTAPRITGSESGTVFGLMPNTTQYTSFTISPSGGTLTGGIIRVYGYRN